MIRSNDGIHSFLITLKLIDVFSRRATKVFHKEKPLQQPFGLFFTSKYSLWYDMIRLKGLR
ncbi:predicted protein [Enterococcus gallinarum EG2]|nr:predicted protein [Enterococcus gallinarum EG2]